MLTSTSSVPNPGTLLCETWHSEPVYTGFYPIPGRTGTGFVFWKLAHTGIKLYNETRDSTHTRDLSYTGL